MVNKNLRIFVVSSLFFTSAMLLFFYWLMTSHGEPLDSGDFVGLLLISLLYGVILSSIFFCFARRGAVAGYLSDLVSWLLSWNRRQVGGSSADNPRRKVLFPPRYYFKIDKDRFELRDVSSDVRHVGVTQIAFESDGSILVVGDQEALNTLQQHMRDRIFYGRIISWFDEAQKMIGNEKAGTAAIRFSILKLSQQYVLPLRPFVVFHIVNRTSYSQDDINMIQNLSSKVGAREIHIWKGGELSDYEIFTGEILDDGWVSKKPCWIKQYSGKQQG